MNDVSCFCDKHNITMLEMDASYFSGKSKHNALDITYSYYLQVEPFYIVIDLHLQDLNNRFDVVSTDFFLGMASLNPTNSFVNFDKIKIMRVAEYYMNEFVNNKLRDLSFLVDSFIVYDCGSDKRFFNLKEISNLTKLTLTLSIAIAYVERTFSFMKYIKNVTFVIALVMTF
ncbi:hypothetical protein H5410_022555 [Solanum commersonii]|uniref:Uncharacterized protein n=1 Tax=Solanum commersonii TaxID=4109 RepID=A0A9J5ZF48_SOLCO|nr:hypothetical protein H5410_022555 [Solanum commersonii]